MEAFVDETDAAKLEAEGRVAALTASLASARSEDRRAPPRGLGPPACAACGCVWEG